MMDLRQMIGKLGVPIEYKSLPLELRIGLGEFGVSELSAKLPKNVSAITQSKDQFILNPNQIIIRFDYSTSTYYVKLSTDSDLAYVGRIDRYNGTKEDLGTIKFSVKDILALITAVDKDKQVKAPKSIDPKTLETARETILRQNKCESSIDLIDCRIKQGVEKSRSDLMRGNSSEKIPQVFGKNH